MKALPHFALAKTLCLFVLRLWQFIPFVYLKVEGLIAYIYYNRLSFLLLWFVVRIYIIQFANNAAIIQSHNRPANLFVFYLRLDAGEDFA